MTEKLKENLIKCVSFAEREMTHRSEWGELNFSKISGHLDLLFKTCKDLLECQLEILAPAVAEQACSNTMEIISVLEQIDQFNIGKQTKPPQEIRDDLVLTFIVLVDRFNQEIGFWIPYLVHQKISMLDKISSLEDRISEEKDKLTELRKAEQKKIEKIIADAKKASGTAGTATFTESFDNESKKQSWIASAWLFSALVFLVLALWLGFKFLPSKVEMDQKIIQLIFPFFKSVAIIGILLAAALWCGRIYRALKHQSAVNRHRALSLQTFESFTSAAHDQHVKDAVLLEATKTIFSHHTTGYLNANADSAGQDFKSTGILMSHANPGKPSADQ